MKKEFDKNENEDTYTKTYESHYCLMEIHSFKRGETSQINNLNFLLRHQTNEQTKPKQA